MARQKSKKESVLEKVDNFLHPRAEKPVRLSKQKDQELDYQNHPKFQKYKKGVN